MEHLKGLFAYYAKWIPSFSEKISGLQDASFPISEVQLQIIKDLKKDILNSVQASVDPTLPFVVETDASDKAIGAILHQGEAPIAFFSRSLSQSEKSQNSVEKEATACIEAIRKWNYYLASRRFTLVTDQRAVSFIFDPKIHGKTKSAKIGRWRLELMGLEFDVKFRPGIENIAEDLLSRDCLNTVSRSKECQRVVEAHEALCHPGVERLLDFIQKKKWPVTLEEVRAITKDCYVCSKVKQNFCKTD